MAHNKRRKVDNENRVFKEEWTEEFLFILNEKTNLPQCLKCNFQASVTKKDNIQRHFRTNHPAFNIAYPLISEKRSNEIKRLKSVVGRSRKIMDTFMSIQERATVASLKVTWRLCRSMKPFMDAELVKKCMLDAIESVVENSSKREELLKKIKEIPLSNNTATRRAEKLSGDVSDKLKACLKKAEHIALAIDESTDKTDGAQLLVYVRYYMPDSGFHEDVLGTYTMEGRTTGADIHEALSFVLRSMEVDFEKIVAITTDGAPAMVGAHQGLVSRLKEQCPQIMSYHCLIHQSVLCAKLGEQYNDAMNMIMKLVNYLRVNSSLRHRNLKSFLIEVEAEYDNLLLHNNVRWLSKGKVLARFWAVRDHLRVFIANDNSVKAVEFKNFLDNPGMMNVISFLVDMTDHLNALNLKLQGRKHTICGLMSDINAFQRKIELFIVDIADGKVFFPTLKKYEEDHPNANVSHDLFLRKLKDNFEARFEDFQVDSIVLAGLVNPFGIKNPLDFATKAKSVFEWVDVAAVASEIIGLQEDIGRTDREFTDPLEFWQNVRDVPATKKLATTILCMFGSTYMCESGFSYMNFIKNKYRTTLTDAHLHQLMRISLTELTPNFNKIAQSSVCHFSH